MFPILTDARPGRPLIVTIIKAYNILFVFGHRNSKNRKPIAAICHGAWMFCSAKILKDKKVTCFVAIKDDVENAGALYEDSPVVVDGNMITSRHPKDLPEFCKAIISQLKK
ncbi:putative cysteine protease YraA [Argopecten irradians]|uniref:putative cysteine protease YraA n=1 Tax=Argopecten irradians TaxID=31199 RepID=UPI0037159E1F